MRQNLLKNTKFFLMATPILSATELQRINITSVDSWNPNQRQIDMYSRGTATLDALLTRQNGIGGMVIEPLTDPNKSNDVRVWWNDFCGREAQDCDGGNSCGLLSGDPSQVDFKDYAITQCITDGFKIEENTFKGSFMSIEQNIADNQRHAITRILNRLNKKAIIFLKANAGGNKGGQFNSTPAKQYVLPTADLSDEGKQSRLYTKIIFDALASRIQNPFLIDYGNFWHLNMNAQFNKGNADGKGDAARSDYFNIFSDIEGRSQLPAAMNSTFLVAPYAYAFVNKSYFQKRNHPVGGKVSFSGSTPVYDEASGKWKYFITIPGYNIVIDVLLERTCVNARKDIYTHVFNYFLHYDFLLNPEGCSGEGSSVNGIVEYVREGSEESDSSASYS